MRYVVYSIFNDKDEIIYIGCSGNLINRINSHLYLKEWANEICKITLERFENKEDALTEESLLIIKVKPKYNTVHNDEIKRKYIKRTGVDMSSKEKSSLDKLIEYFGGLQSSADSLGVSRQYLHDCIKKGYLPYRRGVQVEELTKGAIKASEIWEEAGKLALTKGK